MKYIRTKDGKIYKISQGIFGEYPIDKAGNVLKMPFAECDIIKQADTIEKLCDQFVYVTNNGNHYVKNNHNAIHLFFDDEKPISYYGAIWTDKGLTYVAKMNDKGELELI